MDLLYFNIGTKHYFCFTWCSHIRWERTVNPRRAHSDKRLLRICGNKHLKFCVSYNYWYCEWWWFSRSVVSDSCDTMDSSPPGSSVHGIFQARILDWIAISFSKGSSQPRNRSHVSCISGRFFTDWVMGQCEYLDTKTFSVSFWFISMIAQLQKFFSLLRLKSIDPSHSLTLVPSCPVKIPGAVYIIVSSHAFQPPFPLSTTRFFLAKYQSWLNPILYLLGTWI